MSLYDEDFCMACRGREIVCIEGVEGRCPWCQEGCPDPTDESDDEAF